MGRPALRPGHGGRLALKHERPPGRDGRSNPARCRPVWSGTRRADAAVAAERRTTMDAMAVAPKRLDVRIGDLVEIEGRRYDVVPDKAGGVALEPAITVSARELDERHGTRPATQEEFEELFGDLPSDGEG